MNQNIKIDPYGFREYDARWLYKKDINSSGIENLGRGLGKQIKIHNKKRDPFISIKGKFENTHKSRIIIQDIEKK